MLSDILDSEDLCIKLTDLLEQDSCSLSGSLDGDILDAYRELIRVELERLHEVRMLLMRVEDEIRNI